MSVAVNVSFYMKDQFKAAFRSAKWNAARKVWMVAEGSEKKANEWLAQRDHAMRHIRRLERIRAMRMVRNIAPFLVENDHPDHENQMRLGQIKAKLIARLHAELDATKSATKATARMTKAQKEEAARAARHAEANAVLDGVAGDIEAALESVEALRASGELTRETLAAARAPLSPVRIAAGKLGVVSLAIEAIFVAPESIHAGTIEKARAEIHARKIIK